MDETKKGEIQHIVDKEIKKFAWNILNSRLKQFI